MSYQSAYGYGYRPYRRRRRRRNSHYGVLVALILVIIIAVPVAFQVVKGISSAIFGGDQNELVYQIDNTRACRNGKAVELGAQAPYRNANGVVFVPLDSLCSNLGLELSWDSVGTGATVTYKKNTADLRLNSTTLTFNGENRTMSAAPESQNGTAFVPVLDLCQAFSWQAGEQGEDQGDLLIISQSKKTWDEKKRNKLADEALEVLGPSEKQVSTGSILMRTDSDKLVTDGQDREMTEETGKRGSAAIEQDGTRYVPLKAAITTLGGTASFDGKEEWTVEYNGISSTVRTNGKTHVNGDRVKGDQIKVYQDGETGRFYVSAQLFAALTGKTYTDLGDGAYAFTNMSLDGYDCQKKYLTNLTGGLTEAVGGDIPEADVYVALTFDDGPTGAIEGYPNGLTNYLLDGLKERGVHATFFMVGSRVQMFSSSLPRLVSEGHELGNHTMTHPMQHLTGLDADSIREEIDSNTKTIQEKAGQAPTLLRPVGGGVNADVKSVAKELGFPIINWSLDTQDWNIRDANSVKKAIVDNVKDGDVVLMHDLYKTTVEGVLAAIDELQSRTDQTYAFVTVSELAAVKGINLEPGVVYNGLTEEVAQQIADGTYAPTEFT